MANLFRSLKSIWQEAGREEAIRNQALANAKKAGTIPLIRTAIAAPWEKDPYGKYLNPTPQPSPSSNLFRVAGQSVPVPSTRPSSVIPPVPTRPSPTIAPVTRPTLRPQPTPTPTLAPTPFPTPNYKTSVTRASNWGDIMHQTEQVAKEYDLPVSVVLGQLAAESGRGTHKYSSRNNFFNINANDANPDAAFSYKTPAEGIRAYADLITKSPRYSRAYAARSNPDEYLRLLTEAGYAGDPKTYKKRAQNGFKRYDQFVKSTPEYQYYRK